MQMYITYSEGHDHGKEICEGQENDPWSSYEDRYNFFELEDVRVARPETPYHEYLELAGDIVPDEVYVVVVRYFDGNTFGRTNGYGRIEGVFRTRAEAEAASKEIYDGTWKGPHGYVTWDGYFSGLEDVEIHHRRVKE